MSQFFVYVILLEEMNFLLHTSSFLDKERIFTECISLYEFARKYKPVEVVDFIQDADYIKGIYECNIDFHVKKYMQYYGIQHVRGGTYKDMELPDYLSKSLSLEFETKDKFHRKTHHLLNDIMESYSIDSNLSISELENKIKETEKILSKYQYDYEQFISIKTHGNMYVTENILEEINWFKNYIQFDNSNIDEKTRFRYKSFLSEIKILFNKFIKIKRKDTYAFESESDEDVYTQFIDKKYTICLKVPEFNFDVYMYHPEKKLLLTQEQLDFSLELLKKVEYIYYTVINRCDEYEFNISTYPTNIVDICNSKINYYKYLISNKNPC
jgi:hypothetical protein